MTDREKVIRALENCTAEVKCRDCPWEECEDLDYPHREYPDGLVKEALALLKAQEPRVMTIDELPGWDGAFLIETRVKATVWASWYSEYELYGKTVCRMVDIGGEVDDRFKKLYGHEWRCWTSRPTDEQKEAVKWDD